MYVRLQICIIVVRHDKSRMRSDLQRMTLCPLWTAARTSWWDISPVKYTSASTPSSIPPPEPAHIAIVLTIVFSCSGFAYAT